MKPQYLLSIDAGTTSVRAVVYDTRLRHVHMAQREFTQHYPHPGFVEHDAEEIYSAVLNVIARATRSIDKNRILGIGITNQRETVVLWEHGGKPVHPAVVWQCRRSAGICGQIKEQGFEATFRKKTGLVVDAYFSATKVRWLFDKHPAWRNQAAQGRLKCGTIDSYLIYRLTAGARHVTDCTNASRTLVYNIVKKRWDDELLGILDLPAAMLPHVLPSAADFGVTRGVRGLPDGIPILSAVGDQQASLAGNLGFSAGAVKNTYGTGCFMLLNIGDRFRVSGSGLLTTLTPGFDGRAQYALEGSVFVAGAVVQWLRDGLKLIATAPESEDLARQGSPSRTTFLVPAFVGLGCPHWDMQAQGAMVGLRRETTAADVVRAGLDSIALQVRDVFEEFGKAVAVPVRRMRVDGGASRNDYLMQFQADMLGITLERAAAAESTALGAAVLAGGRAGLFGLAEVKKLVAGEREFIPRMSKPVRAAIAENWRRAVEAVRAYKPQQ